MRETDSTIVSRSSGTSVRGSITSTSIPSPASSSAAASASWTRRESATTVTSRPGRTTRARPIGTSSRSRLLAAEVERLVLDVDDRVRVGDRGAEEPGGIGRGGRHDHLQPGHVREPGLQALRVLRAAALAGAALRPQHQRHRQLAARHEVRLRRLVDELVEGERDEVDEHDLDHRPQARLRRADRDPGDRRLADRRVADALGAELLGQPGGRAPRAALGDVLAEDEDALVVAHLLGQRLRDRLEVRRLAHA